MKASLLAVSLALGAMLAAPVAAAQASCIDLNDVIEAAEIDFVDVVGEEIDDDLFAATSDLPGAEGCTVDYVWDSTYTCFWTLADAAATTRFVDAQLAVMRSCLVNSGWSEEALDPDENAEWRLLSGFNFIGGDDDELVFTLRADASTDSPTRYEVSVFLTYLLF